MNRPYNLFYDNGTGRIIVQKLDSQQIKTTERLKKFTDKDIVKKINDFNIEKINLDQNRSSLITDEKITKNDLYITEPSVNQTYIDENKIKEEINEKINNFNKISPNNKLSLEDILNNSTYNIKKNALFGIKKIILSDFNYSGNSSNNSDFKIGLNKNLNRNNGTIFDCFYLSPSISEINTKNETNYINEKKVEIFTNNQDSSDIQYFPLDYVPIGCVIPFRIQKTEYKKVVIKNIFWNIFQSIDSTKYENDEILSLVPDKSDFIYKSIKLQLNFEIHSQVNQKNADNYKDSILPYKNIKVKNINPSTSCLYKIASLQIDTLSGTFSDNIEINLFPDINVQSGLLCVKISVPNDCIETLKGYDKLNKVFYGNIPFSQFIVNFDYEIV